MYSNCKSLRELCDALSANPPAADFDFASLPKFGPRPEWARDDLMIASWDAGSVIELPERPGELFLQAPNS